MKINKGVIAILILLSLWWLRSKMQENYYPHYEKKADVVAGRVVKNLERKYGLQLIGTGGGMMYDIRLMSLHFASWDKLNLDEARELIVNCEEAFLNEVNQDESIRPYLHNYPATLENVQVTIDFYSWARWTSKNSISGIATSEIRKSIYYYREEYKTDLSDIFLIEDYGEALQKVRQTPLENSKN